MTGTGELQIPPGGGVTGVLMPKHGEGKLLNEHSCMVQPLH